MRRHKRATNKKYLAWIHTQPCIVGDKRGAYCDYTMHAHHAGVRGLGQKAPDETAVSLCSEHHLHGEASAHKLGVNFWSHWGLDKDAEIARLQALYCQETGSTIAE